MTQNNIYMEDNNLVLYVDVQPLFLDELENSKNAASAYAENARLSATNAETLLNSITTYKTNIELFYAQAYDNLADFKNNTIQAIQSLYNSLTNQINILTQQILNRIETLGQTYVNRAKDYAEQAQDTVDNRVSLEHLNQSKGLETGNVSTDSDVLTWIKQLYHSTFDRSKFTVVGSPVITDGGIVSGFGSANDTKRIAIPFNYPTQNFKLKGCLTIGNGDGSIIGSWNVNPPFSLYVHGSDGKYAIPSIAFDVNGTRTVTKLTNAYYSGSAVFQIPDDFTQGKYYYYFEREGTTFTFGMRKEGVEQFTTASITSEYDLYLASNNTQIVATSQSLNNLISADLKEVSLTVDGMPVFSGNKTGIDTIKPDDYTVVGTPTITDDGIASGFSSSNYLTFALNSSTSQNWEMEFIIKTPASNSIIENYIAIISRHSTPFQVYCTKSASTSTLGYWNIELGENKILRMSLYWNTNYKLSIVNHNGIITLNVLNLDTNNTDSISTSQTYEIYLNGTWRLGVTQSGNFGFQGSIDLNAFKIYVDGDLVYQPCLKIPFTLSKTGSKIVDSVYRDRVNDMYQQFGYASYHTLSNIDFTLPKGELYGMFENLRKLIIDRTTQAEE